MSLTFVSLPDARRLNAAPVRPGGNLTASIGNLRLPHLAADVDAKIATVRRQLTDAFELVYDRYLDKGYINPCPGRLVYHHVLGSSCSRTFVAVDRGNTVLGTLSVVGDNPLGLQAESTYPQEVKSLRARGRRLAEVTCLAIREQHRLLASNVFFALTKVMIHYACRREYSDLLMTVHPRHSRFYYRYFRPYPVGPCRPHAWANNNPAVCHRIDLEQLCRNVSEDLWQQYFSEPIPAAELERPPIRPADHAYFCRRSGIDSDAAWNACKHQPRKTA